MSTPGRSPETGPVPVAPERQILVACIGEAWGEDGANSDAVATALGGRELPSGVSVHELGTGALDIAYDVMRAYDAVVLIDVDRRHHGTAEASVADETEVDATIEDGQELNHLGMDAPTVLHFIKHTGGWPGQVVIVGCAPDGGQDAADAALDLAFERIEELRRA
ncbi:MAG: hydrogenase maturation protease [Solirubrobacteraceae bacterium]|jgi:hydrogenase maturation protease|nr:hydrogenase maturation protease [Solirubrobacteraceae bacterium]